jgi:5-methylcytosine-specific restriction protein B
MPTKLTAPLLPIFLKRFPDFESFQQENSSARQEEEYKRDILKSWKSTNASEKIKVLAKAGRGKDALKLFRKSAKFGRPGHPMGQFDIPKELEQDEAKLVTLFEQVVEATNNDTPLHCLYSLLDRCKRFEIPMNWSLFFFLLWLYRPEDFFPVKISIVRSIAKECDFEITEGQFCKEAVVQIYDFVLKVHDELAEFKPRDLLDAQSFIWSCHSEMQKNNELHKLWDKFLKQWPIERLRNMTLGEYTNLKTETDDYFCHWIERKTQALGSIQGGTSAKFGIYLAGKIKDKLRSGLTTDGRYIWWDQLGTTAEEAFEDVKSYVIKIAESSAEGDHTLPPHNHIGPMFQLKIRFLYQAKPHQVLPIYSKELINFASKKHLNQPCKKYKDLVATNLELKSTSFPDADVFEAADQLWAEYKSKNDSTPRRYWAGGIDWGGVPMQGEFIENNEWRMGWNEDSVEEKPKAQKFLDLFSEIKVGDYFAMKGYGGRNDLKVHYVGEVLEKDEENNALSLKPLKDVPLYHGKAPKVGAGGSWFGSVTPITNPEAISKIFGINDIPQPETPSMSTPKELNEILYGPPGTGKTYSTIRKAVDIIDGEHDELANQRFQQLKREGRIEFLTFHQSYSYEDFVEGIRPDVDDDGEARFTCQNGIFKEIALKATYECLQEITAHEGPSFSELWERLLEVIDEHESFRIQLKTQVYVPKITARGNIEATKENDPGRVFGSCGRKSAQEVFTKLRSFDEVNSGDVHRAMERGANWHLIAAVVNELKKLEKEWEPANEQNPSQASKKIEEDEMVTIVSSYLKSGENSGYKLKPQNEWPPYVLIIDEINRGNISKILGELITLLEPDKRIGAENELSVQLPYSKEVFAVPGNLHLIGTMNTADKSIALVDVALRRRFQFKELNPDFSLCETLPDGLRQIMETINQRVMLRKDRDHRIGHAYFMRVDSEESFDEAMKLKIIPLLSEYFYNDWDGLRFVLGENEKNTGLIRPLNGEAGIGRNRWQWYYDLGEDVSPAEALLSNFNSDAEGGE